jgi:N6-adenosine-specific RNA methylase IME4
LTTRKRGRVFPLLTEAQVQTVFAPKPRRGEHSRKPAKVRSNIVELLGDHRSKAELFAREEFEGWNAFGDELVAA